MRQQASREIECKSLLRESGYLKLSKLDNQIRNKSGVLSWIAARILNQTASIFGESCCYVGVPVHPKISLSQEIRPIIRIGSRQVTCMFFREIVCHRRVMGDHHGFAAESVSNS